MAASVPKTEEAPCKKASRPVSAHWVLGPGPASEVGPVLIPSSSLLGHTALLLPPKRLRFHSCHKRRTSPCQHQCRHGRLSFGSESTLGIPSGGGVASVAGAHLLQRAVLAHMLPRRRPHNLVAGRPAAWAVAPSKRKKRR